MLSIEATVQFVVGVPKRNLVMSYNNTVLRRKKYAAQISTPHNGYKLVTILCVMMCSIPTRLKIINPKIKFCGGEGNNRIVRSHNC